MKIPINKEFDLSALTDEIKTALKRDVALSGRQPGQFDDKGAPLPGVIVILDSATGEPLVLPPGSQSLIQSAIASHTPPPKEKSQAKQLKDSLTTSSTVEDLKAALLGYATSLVDREQRSRDRVRSRARR